MLHRAHLHVLSLVLAVAAVLSDIQPGYLDFDNLPETNFSCEGKVIGGYYADVETGCQMFHVCTIGQKGEVSDIKFLCLNGTVFDQETRVCERIDEVDCDKSEDFFNLNLELYGNTANFGTQDCGDEECEEDEEVEDAEYDDDTESTTILTTTTTTTRATTTTRPTTVRTTPPPPTLPRTRYTTQAPDALSAFLALHNAFNQGLNRRPILNPVSTTRIPSLPTTTRRPNIPLTLRTRFGTPDSRQENGYILRSTLRPTFQPSFTSSLQTPLKSNYHTFESGDAHFAHSFDPEKPYHFQYFAQKSSPSPFTVRIEPQVSVVTSTSTSTSIKIANTTVDDFPYDEYDDVDPFFHDVPRLNRPKRSTTRSGSSRAIKSNPHSNRVFGRITPVPSGFVKQETTHESLNSTLLDKRLKFDVQETKLPLNHHVQGGNSPSGFVKQETSTIQNNFSNDQLSTSSPDLKPSPSDHVIKIDPDDVLIAKNYTPVGSEPKSMYLNNLLDSIAMEDGEKKQVLDLFKKSEPEMEQLLGSKGVDMMLEKLENKLLEMELEGRGSGVPFEYEGESVEIREKRGSDNKSFVGGYDEKQSENENNDKLEDSFACTNPDFCVVTPKYDDVIKLEIEDRHKRSAVARTRVSRVRGDENSSVRDKRIGTSEEEIEAYSDENQRTTKSPQTNTTKKTRRRGSKQHQGRSQPQTSRNSQNRRKPNENSDRKSHEDSDRKAVWTAARRLTNKEKEKTPTRRPDIKPVTEEIEGDVTTAEYRRPPITLNSKMKKHAHSDNTTPYPVSSSTRLQTRFEYDNQKNNNLTTKKSYSTQKPIYYRHVPVYEDDDNPESIDIQKQKPQKKSQRIHKRSPIIVHDDYIYSPSSSDRLRRQDNINYEDEVRFESVPITRTAPRNRANIPRTPIQQEYNTQRKHSPVHRTSNDNQNMNEHSLTRAHFRTTEVNNPTRSRSRQRTTVSNENEHAILSNSNSRERTDNTYPSRTNARIPETRTSHQDHRTSGRTRVRTQEPNLETHHQSRGNSSPPVRGEKSGLDEVRSSYEYEGSKVSNSEPRGVVQSKVVLPFNAERIEFETGSIMRPSIRTNFDHTSTRANSRPPFQETTNLNNHQIDGSRNEPTAHTPQRVTGRRRKVVRNRAQFSDRSVLPEEISYATLRPEIYPRQNVQTTKQNVENVPRLIDTERVAVTTTTVPPTPYTPGPGIEADPAFSCRGKVKGGLYADVHSECHGFFICSQAKRGIAATHFWCGVGTKFNQKSRTCQSESLVDCSVAQRLYHLNDNQYNPSIDLEEKLRGSFEPMKV